jgi:hypothetical protein
VAFGLQTATTMGLSPHLSLGTAIAAAYGRGGGRERRERRKKRERRKRRKRRDGIRNRPVVDE